MRIATCLYQRQSYLAVIHNDAVILPALHPRWPAAYKDVLALIDGGVDALSQLRRLVAAAPASIHLPLPTVQLLAPIPRPRRNIICLGWNYASHAQESTVVQGKQAELPEYPVVFTKATTTVNAPEGDIPYDPQVSTQLDWEVELGVIIGKTSRHITKGNALQHVFGYIVINDISARDVQFRHKQYFLGKSVDGACPMGPWIVTADAVADPQDLDLSCRVNGVEKQSSNTRYQIFDIATTISMLSQVMTLEPGDIIATGTPSGVGFARQPPEFLQPGDVVECEVRGIGCLRNRVTAAS